MSHQAFSPTTDTLLQRAGAICEARGSRLTDLRRHVLGLILDAPAPTGAYDLLDRLRQTRQGAAPPTVYRALDFLLEQGLVHRLESLSAFVGCVAPEGVDDHHHEAEAGGHPAQFLICRTCARVIEIEDPEVAQALAQAAQRVGFRLGRVTVEAEGLCAPCAAAGTVLSARTAAAP